MLKIQYKYRKWDKEVKERKSVNALENDCKNIKTKIDLYLYPEMFKNEFIYNYRIHDSTSFFDQLGLSYFILACDKYILENDAEASIGYLYLYVKALARSYELELSDVEIFTQDSDIPVNVFNTAVGYELLENSIYEAEQLVKDYIDVEEKELRRTDNFID